MCAAHTHAHTHIVASVLHTPVCTFSFVSAARTHAIGQALHEINEAQRELERRQQLVEIQSKLELNGWPVNHFAIVQDGRYARFSFTFHSFATVCYAV